MGVQAMGVQACTQRFWFGKNLAKISKRWEKDSTCFNNFDEISRTLLLGI